MADDDLDQLLDEVESKYCSPGAAAASRVDGADKKKPNRSKSKVVEASTEEDNIDDLIEDILDVDFKEDGKKQRRKSANQQSNNTSNQLQKKTCSPIYAGGSNIPFGIGTSISERACNQLRCTACDFNVMMFDDCEWDPSCDYYFFRNSMPEVNKLQTKTVRKYGVRAYACQCSWRSVKETFDLRRDQQLRWVCGKH
ncbi:cilia- and flagella-associated protein 418 isoform 1-T2 [Discoglossus pictus]